jgi:hypothetical protein
MIKSVILNKNNNNKILILNFKNKNIYFCFVWLILWDRNL